MSHTCEKCKADKPAGEMIQRGGKPSSTCKACFAAAIGAAAAKRSGGGKAVTPAPSSPVTEMPHLAIEAGYGVTARIDDDRLRLEQPGAEGETDVVCLTRTEARAVFEEFEAWANA